MTDQKVIWRLGRWIARREDGTARLGWTAGEVVVRVLKSRIVAVEGLDTSQLAGALGCEPMGSDDLLKEARALAQARNIPETQAVGCAKAVLAPALRAWFSDPAREIELLDGPVEEIDGPTISITHAFVELILGAGTEETTRLDSLILPDLDVLLRRTPSFLKLYAPLRLSEEADLVVAKISGQRTAREIVSRAPQDQQDVRRLLAALVAAGMLEPAPVTTPSEKILLPDDRPPPPAQAQSRWPAIPRTWFAVAATVAVVMLGLLAVVMIMRLQEPPAEGTWTLVLDVGCEPQDLQRISKITGKHPLQLRAQQAGQDSSCWRLIWGEFPSQLAAEESIEEIPEFARKKGFEPHAIELIPSDNAAAETAAEE